jgi:GTPase
MSFTLAIVGRPNVGKSTLFNRLVGRRLALVDDTPSVTRDRREGEGRLGDLAFTAVDTAGLEQGAPASLSGRVRMQTEAAIAAADAILFVVDARAGVLPEDHAFADLVRRARKPVILVANKSEGPAGATATLESYALGLGEPVAISAEHGEGLADLYDAMRFALGHGVDAPGQGGSVDAPAPDDAERAVTATGVVAEAAAPIRVAVLGRPNSGKSTLINRLLGQERVLTGPEPGITRDAIAVDLDWQGRAFRLFDTAGLRRRAKVEQKLEQLSVADALRAMRFAEVVVVLMEVAHAFEDQDLRIAALVEREGRATVLAANKWDLTEPAAGAIASLREQADRLLPQLGGVPVVALSGLTGHGLNRLMQAVVESRDVWNRRVATPALNRWLRAVVAEHPPPAVAGRRIKLNYITQPKTRPPSFVVFSSRADALPETYRRYLVNGLRDAFELPGTPIRLTVREKPNPYDRRR